MYTDMNKDEICRLQDTVCGRLFEYSLCETVGETGEPDGYYISAKVVYLDSKDERTAFLGHDRDRAIRLFKLIACNAASPCALDDIISDLELADLTQ